MSHTSVTNGLVKLFEKEVIKVFIKKIKDEGDSVRRGIQCKEVIHNGRHCTRPSGHSGPHVATSGDKYLLDAVPGKELGSTPIDLLWAFIERAATAEYKKELDGIPLGAGRCYNSPYKWYCTRPKDHVGPHIALRDREELLEIWRNENDVRPE